MQMIVAIVSLALLMCVQATSAQSAAYSVSVRVHNSLPRLSASDVNSLLDKASKMLQKNNLGHPESDDDVKCDVTFTLKGPVGTFSDPPGAIVNQGNIDAVMNSDLDDADFHIKVVQKIEFCRPGVEGNQAGCAFSPPRFRSIVVVHPGSHPSGPGFPDHLLWAHEFGHLTGLGHRESQSAAETPHDEFGLMTRCNLKDQFSGMDDAKVQVNRDECRRLLAGPGHRSPGPFKLPQKCGHPPH